VNDALEVAKEVASIAGLKALAHFAKAHELVVEEKGRQDFVSIADRETEQVIVEELRLRFPDHAFLGEESHKDVDGKRPTWVIDPIDGTTNFLRGIPIFAVSIGLVIDGDVELGVIHIPTRDETFCAQRGKGAFLDGERIAVSRTSDMTRALVSLGSSRRTGAEPYHETIKNLTQAGAETRRLGSACVQIASVACGRLDAYIEHHLNAWDVAAGLCILREAGAKTNDFTAGEWLKDGNPFLCATPALYEAVSSASGIR
jgi:myo-inositol-1(or 4)-monophosphatase